MPILRVLRTIWLLAAALCLGLLATLLTAPAAQAAPVSVLNGTQFTDPNGDPVQAHGGGVLKVGQYYYWFGENRQETSNAFRYVSAYRSTDLRNWEFRNHVLTQSTHSELQSANIERPKVIYNRATGQFVMWMHKENAQDYSEARAAVAVSDTVDGDYTWRGSFRPLGHMSRDITAFVDDDGTGYMVSAARENYDLHIYRLTPDYTAVESLVANPWPGGHREAPALFKRDGVYFMLTSGATGWSPNQQQYATSTSLAGGWSAMRNVGDATAFGSQTAYVLQVQGTAGTSYLYMGDRWGNSFGGRVNDSRYVWLPLTFPDSRSLSMSWAPELTIDTAAGTVRGTGGPYQTFTARHSGKCLDIPSQSQAVGQQLAQYTCNGGGNQRFWPRDVGGGHVQLVTRHSSLCLAASGGSTAAGAAVVQAPCGGGQEQQWRITDTGDGHVRIAARHSGLCLDVSDESTADSARLIQYTCSTTATHQQFRRTTA
ncbi:RICIN domain-containing protein [Streptomyces millisiae]|uniref:RICIN domain-containing protein n=1 Tax=Streptomyces millisiae TaxID=3075542 RepID=A0ABU2LXX8_9ACTN|nr:RICIN domain-containing protein [Streptomyces sp. DSM 44918]MDT0322444.1 RICIN domain-containing protein [Streptomyces sp. DSM 44918]